MRRTILFAALPAAISAIKLEKEVLSQEPNKEPNPAQPSESNPTSTASPTSAPVATSTSPPAATSTSPPAATSTPAPASTSTPPAATSAPAPAATSTPAPAATSTPTPDAQVAAVKAAEKQKVAEAETKKATEKQKENVPIAEKAAAAKKALQAQAAAAKAKKEADAAAAKTIKTTIGQLRKQAFVDMDTDKDGRISEEELRTVLTAAGYPEYVQDIHIKKIKKFDKDNNGFDINELMDTNFDREDKDKDNQLSKTEAKNWMRNYRGVFREDQDKILERMAKFDKDGNNYWSKEEMIEWFKKGEVEVAEGSLDKDLQTDAHTPKSAYALATTAAVMLFATAVMLF